MWANFRHFVKNILEKKYSVTDSLLKNKSPQNEIPTLKIAKNEKNSYNIKKGA
jgi:hypothetical protein